MLRNISKKQLLFLQPELNEVYGSYLHYINSDYRNRVLTLSFRQSATSHIVIWHGWRLTKKHVNQCWFVPKTRCCHTHCFNNACVLRVCFQDSSRSLFKPFVTELSHARPSILRNTVTQYDYNASRTLPYRWPYTCFIWPREQRLLPHV